jgi:hypothetical protein
MEIVRAIKVLLVAPSGYQQACEQKLWISLSAEA